jgi:hypothetical protein
LTPSRAQPPSKAPSTPADLAPEIVQVIAVVAEIMLEQRRRRPVEGNSVGRMIPNDPAKKESFEGALVAVPATH